MHELKRIQSRLSYQLGRLSSTLVNVASATKASEASGSEKMFLLGQAGKLAENETFEEMERERRIDELHQKKRQAKIQEEFGADFERDSLDGSPLPPQRGYLPHHDFQSRIRGRCSGKREGWRGRW